MRRPGILLALGLLAASAAAALAQTATDVPLSRAEIQKARQAIVKGNLTLTEEESLAFWPAYRDYRLDMARLGDRLAKVITAFTAAGGSLSDAQAGQLLDEYLDIKAQEASLKKKHAKTFRKLLPAPKVARFFQLENKMDAILNSELAAAIPLAH